MWISSEPATRKKQARRKNSVPAFPLLLSLKKTLVVGASPNPERYSNRAVLQLLKAGHPVVAWGKRTGTIGMVSIKTKYEMETGIHTVTMYVGAGNQHVYYDAILALPPARIIFNPGAENPEFYEMAANRGIEVTDECTLVMLSVGTF